MPLFRLRRLVAARLEYVPDACRRAASAGSKLTYDCFGVFAAVLNKRAVPISELIYVVSIRETATAFLVSFCSFIWSLVCQLSCRMSLDRKLAMSDVQVFSTLAAALLLAFVHQWALYLHLNTGERRKYWFALADGVSITYIFLQLLPEISHLLHETSEHHDRTYMFGGGADTILGWMEHHPFFPLLVGFTSFYGLEKWIEKSSPKKPSTDQINLSVHFWVHIVGLSLYKVLLGYLLTRTDGWISLGVFTVAMGLHFLVMDVHLLEMHQRAYTLFGRWALIAAFMTGWGIGTQVAISPPLLALLLSFVAGSAVLMIIQDEFSDNHPTCFPVFVGSVALYSGLMFVL